MFNLFNKTKTNNGEQEPTPAFDKAAERVANYVEALPLTEEQVSELMKRIADYVHEAKIMFTCFGANQARIVFENEIKKVGKKNGKRNDS